MDADRYDDDRRSRYRPDEDPRSSIRTRDSSKKEAAREDPKSESASRSQREMMDRPPVGSFRPTKRLPGGGEDKNGEPRSRELVRLSHLTVKVLFLYPKVHLRSALRHERCGCRTKTSITSGNAIITALSEGMTETEIETTVDLATTAEAMVTHPTVRIETT